MTAASMPGTADFDRDVRQQISQVRKLGSAPTTKTWVLNAAIKTLGRPTLFLLDAVLRVAHRRLVRKTERMELAIAWFNDSYDDFYERVSQRAYIPDQKFTDDFRQLRAKNRHLITVCRKSSDDLRPLGVAPEVATAFDNLAGMAAGMDAALARFEILAVAAQSCEAALRRSMELSKDIRGTLEDFDRDDQLMDDPELVAASRAAVQRMRAQAV
ncbi:hypothetical protein [Polaromonas sp. YR568]|uniref:hypothetical protein n=1 Tax=Polaromonas sp. YR568 TaxID=1855301 RepID=UPI00398C242C